MMTVGEQRHAAVVEAQLRRIADALEKSAPTWHDTAEEMMHDALTSLMEWKWVQDLRYATNTREEAERLFAKADQALTYFETCRDQHNA